jgi:hypothetical protein
MEVGETVHLKVGLSIFHQNLISIILNTLQLSDATSTWNGNKYNRSILTLTLWEKTSQGICDQRKLFQPVDSSASHPSKHSRLCTKAFKIQKQDQSSLTNGNNRPPSPSASSGVATGESSS